MARDVIAHSLAGGSTSIAAGTTFHVPVEPGQIGIIFRYFSGSSLLVGGASLGTNGFLVSNAAAHTYLQLPIGGTYSVRCVGTSVVYTYIKLYDEGVTGAQG